MGARPHCQGLSSDPSVPLFWGVGFMKSCSRSAFWQRSWAPQTSVGGVQEAQGRSPDSARSCGFAACCVLWGACSSRASNEAFRDLDNLPAPLCLLLPLSP